MRLQLKGRSYNTEGGAGVHLRTTTIGVGARDKAGRLHITSGKVGRRGAVAGWAPLFVERSRGDLNPPAVHSPKAFEQMEAEPAPGHELQARTHGMAWCAHNTWISQRRCLLECERHAGAPARVGARKRTSRWWIAAQNKVVIGVKKKSRRPERWPLP